AEMLEELSDIYKHHIALEDSRVFPLAGRLLTPAEVEAVGREMAARRGMSLTEQGLLTINHLRKIAQGQKENG
ncbi:MAG TPA: hypothetical protein VNO70_14680, partial [Blastocatellia bacterium]|nr:hypothetical protein [Blastocatellia bacterium]